MLSGIAAIPLRAELPNPILNQVFPAGGQAGTTASVLVEGGNLEGLSTLRFADPRIVVQKGEGNQFQVTIPADCRPGLYDVRAVGTRGVSAPRGFFVGVRPELRDTEPNDTLAQPQTVAMDSVVNGRLDKAGDIDCFRFAAKAGQRLVVELWSERIDGMVRGVIEVYDAAGRRLAVNRGDRGIDPCLELVTPADSEYTVKLFDQTYSGGSEFVYRLDIDTGPRTEFAFPPVVQEGKAARVRLFGTNLSSGTAAENRTTPSSNRAMHIDVDVPTTPGEFFLPLRPSRTHLAGHRLKLPGSPLSASVATTDIPIVVESSSHATPETAQAVTVPCEIGGQLIEGDERDWYAVEARKGEVLWLEGYGDRIGSPVDLDLVVLTQDNRELLHLEDHVTNLGGTRFPMRHTDPAGRFVVPADGRYLILVRNVTAGIDADPRRLYRISIRREEPDYRLTLVPRRSDAPTGLNIPRGGREVAEVFIERQRGFQGAVRLTAGNLPAGIECPESWIGPEADHGVLVFTASSESPTTVHSLVATGRADFGGGEVSRPVRGGTMVRAARPTGWGRITEEVCLAVGPEGGPLVTATPGETHVFQDSIVDVAVDVERRAGCDGAVQIAGVGLPAGMESPLAIIPAGETRGWLSFAIPASLPPGPFTLAIQADTDVMVNKAKVAVTTFSNPITMHVEKARIRLTIDPRTPRKIARGKIIQVKYRAERLNGFIGKVHTELAAPGGVTGIRGRGVTFTSQQETGDIQVIATDNAAPGQLVFLRLEAVGTVEDQPVYHAGRFLELEIIE